MTRTVVLLGSTGSIGTQALEVIEAAHGDRIRSGSRWSPWRPAVASWTCSQIRWCGSGCRRVAVSRGTAEAVRVAVVAAAARAGVPRVDVEVLVGPDAATEVAGIGADVVLNGITGSIGLRPTLAALAAGSTLALANKESLVAGGPLVRAAQQRADQIVPVDSEHSAIAQALRSGRRDEVARIILTASGGPFRGWSRDQLAEVTPAQALAHPTWAMGPVVTTNSATLVNKGLELIEAHLLFDVAVRRHHRRRPSAVRDPLDGRVRRRLDHRPGIAAGHAAADRARAGVARPGPGRRLTLPVGPRRLRGRSNRSTTRRSLLSIWRARRSAPPRPTPLSTTPRTRSASMPSSRAGSASSTSSTPSPACSTSTRERRRTGSRSRPSVRRRPGRETVPSASSRSADHRVPNPLAHPAPARVRRTHSTQGRDEPARTPAHGGSSSGGCGSVR